MLFDLKSGKRRRFIQVVFGFLAFIFFISFVGFGIGGDVSGGIFDAIGLGGNNGSGSASTQYQQQIDDAEDEVAQNPKDSRALLDLTRYRYLAGQEELDTSGEVPTPTEDARAHWNAALDAWDSYLKTKPKKPDTFVTGQMLFVHQVFNDAGGAAETQQLLLDQNPNANGYADLAYFLYFEGDIEKGDQAADKAIELAKKSEREEFVTELDKLAKQARSLKKAEEVGGAAEGEESGLQSPFGGLGADPGADPGALPTP
jgi:tetratricopeptide (TPR) repeat protein